jgi:anti-sigma28 factor (negative regulator of flagellin synthesis)
LPHIAVTEEAQLEPSPFRAPARSINVMDTYTRPHTSAPRALDIAHIARPESVVILAETVRRARELRGERIDGLKERMSDGAYNVSSKRLAQRVLATIRNA